MFKNDSNNTDASKRNYTNQDFEGFCVDLLEEMAHILKFRYKIKPILTTRYDDMVDEVKNKVKQRFLSLCRTVYPFFVCLSSSRKLI